MRGLTLALMLGVAAVAAPGQASAANAVEIVPVRGHIYMIAGAGGNITVSVGPDGVLLVDSGLAQMTDQVLAAIRELQQRVRVNGAPPKPIRYIINTHLHPDHIGGNEKIGEAGKTITGGNVAGDIGDASEGATIIAHEKVLDRLSPNGNPTVPFRALPTLTYLSGQMKLSQFFNGEGIQIFHEPAAHTDGDSIVFFRGSDVIAAGDIFLTTSYPSIDLANGGSLQGVIDGLNHILDLSVAEFRTEGGTLVIPGHGRICDSADVAYYRDMATIVRDRLLNMIKKHMTLEQVQAAKPTADWDPRYDKNPRWTPDMFVEAAYKSLTQGK
ncbi:MAG TPA: MBL fold metallo-hydrolase [Bryobacteraceae bacterium]|nr:MBL fold metallo-hydrolase [Bryobacteraceae bacterium]